MKYIITERQRTMSIALRLYQEGNPIKKINEITGIPIETIILSIKDYDDDIDCAMSYYWIDLLFRYTDLLKTEYESIEGQIEISYERFGDTVEYGYKTKEYILSGFATPYWGGECNLPIENTNYYDIIADEDEDDDWSTNVDIPDRFYNISELIDWFNNDYFRILFNELKKYEYKS